MANRVISASLPRPPGRWGIAGGSLRKPFGMHRAASFQRQARRPAGRSNSCAGADPQPSMLAYFVAIVKKGL